MFTSEQLKRIAKHGGYTGSPEDEELLVLSKTARWDAIKSSANLDKRRIAAVIELQRNWRGYKLRSKLPCMDDGIASIICTNGYNDLDLTDSFEASKFYGEPSSSKKSSRLDRMYDLHKDDAVCSSNIPLPFKEFCCTLIQRWWRSAVLKKGHEAVIGKGRNTSRQSSFDSNFVRKSNVRVIVTKELQSNDQRETRAAKLIQRCWRRHVDMQVYKYYKDLIGFKSGGHPAMMLKSINPNERHLIDTASGLHVRFRLGGEKFPPSIYYKIFTNQSITDVGALAPRVYTDSHNKLLPMAYIHNKSELIDAKNIFKDESSFYQRCENNGWRIVSDKMGRHSYEDSAYIYASQKRSKFNPSKHARKIDVERRKKQRKIEWMKKMYRDGASSNQDNDLTTLVDSTANGIITASQTGMALSVEDWEVDELLRWTKALNFDQYLCDWKTVGTTSSLLVKDHNERSDEHFF